MSAAGERGRVIALGQVRGVLAERVILSSDLDPFLSLRALAAYSGLSVRRLRDLIADAVRPLPCYRVAGKLLVRRSDFDGWIAPFRQVGRPDIGRIAADVLRDFQ